MTSLGNSSDNNNGGRLFVDPFGTRIFGLENAQRYGIPEEISTPQHQQQQQQQQQMDGFGGPAADAVAAAAAALMTGGDVTTGKITLPPLPSVPTDFFPPFKKQKK